MKKLPELVKKQSEILRNEIVANGYSKDIADKIADELSKKGGLTKCAPIIGDNYRKLRISGKFLKSYLPNIREIKMWHC